MEIKIKPLRRQDVHKAIQFAITGMHFDWYLKQRCLLQLYGTYFLYAEMVRATHMIAAYDEDQLAGLLLAEFKDQPKIEHSFWKSVYVKIFNVLQQMLARDGVGPYDEVNQIMADQYLRQHRPDGEILFLAADPQAKVRGIGTALLQELTSLEKGKEVMLYTDHACTYQFYEHRGFERFAQRDVVLDLYKTKVPLTCFLYHKRL